MLPAWANEPNEPITGGAAVAGAQQRWVREGKLLEIAPLGDFKPGEDERNQLVLSDGEDETDKLLASMSNKEKRKLYKKLKREVELEDMQNQLLLSMSESAGFNPARNAFDLKNPNISPPHNSHRDSKPQQGTLASKTIGDWDSDSNSDHRSKRKRDDKQHHHRSASADREKRKHRKSSSSDHHHHHRDRSRDRGGRASERRERKERESDRRQEERRPTRHNNSRKPVS
jgi:hypothetical protein